jgi:hypothetical protein
MKRRSPSRQQLHWVLQRGSQRLAVQVCRTGDTYEISVSAAGQRGDLYSESCAGRLAALRAHAALVVDCREAGWRSIAYR